MQPVVAQLTEALIPLVAALGSWALFAAANWLRTKAKNEYQLGVIARLTDAVATVVREIEQTTIADIKEAAADGVISDVEYAAIRENAIARTKDYLGKNGVRDLEKVFDAEKIESVIRSKIEAEVHKLKSEPTPVPVEVKKESVSP